MTQLTTYFDLPTAPDQIGVNLPDARLRAIDFSALDYDTCMRSMIEYIQTYYPDEFNDFVASNGMMMLLEIQASNVAKLSLRADMLANEAFLPTARSEEAIINHLALIDQTLKLSTPAVVDIQCTVQSPLDVDVPIPAGTIFQVRGPNGRQVDYELYAAPGDFDDPIVIPAGKRGVIGFGIQGRFASLFSVTSTGATNQTVVIEDEDILSEPIEVYVGGVAINNRWKVVSGPFENYGPMDRVVRIRNYQTSMEIIFGDNVNGMIPPLGTDISIRYRRGGGVVGRIPSGAINVSRSISLASVGSSLVEVAFQNIMPSSGGTDKETPEKAKKRAPRDHATRSFASDRPASIITKQDYIQVAQSFSHPAYGSIAKASVATRTSLNANIVDLYVLANGPNGLVTPSSGLKQALATYVDMYNCITDQTVVKDGSVFPVDLDMSVTAYRNSDVTIIRSQIDVAISDIFDIDKREMGQGLNISEIMASIHNIDGIRSVDVFSPVDNIQSTTEFISDDEISPNQMLVLGSSNIRIYYERAS